MSGGSSSLANSTSPLELSFQRRLAAAIAPAQFVVAKVQRDAPKERGELARAARNPFAGQILARTPPAPGLRRDAYRRSCACKDSESALPIVRRASQTPRHRPASARATSPARRRSRKGRTASCALPFDACCRHSVHPFEDETPAECEMVRKINVPPVCNWQAVLTTKATISFRVRCLASVASAGCKPAARYGCGNR